jgi:hypothetical protein
MYASSLPTTPISTPADQAASAQGTTAAGLCGLCRTDGDVPQVGQVLVEGVGDLLGGERLPGVYTPHLSQLK